MKTHLALLLSLVALVGCTPRTAPSVTQGSSSENASSTAASKRYVNPKIGFSFDYPADWDIRDASKAEEGFDVVAWLYTPQAFAVLENCEKTHKPSEWQLQCGSVQANSAVGVYNYGNINYDALDDFAKTSFPQYRKLQGLNLDAFEYDGRSDPPSWRFHINGPDGKSGITFIVFSPNGDKLAIARSIVSTVTFTK